MKISNNDINIFLNNIPSEREKKLSNHNNYC